MFAFSRTAELLFLCQNQQQKLTWYNLIGIFARTFSGCCLYLREDWKTIHKDDLFGWEQQEAQERDFTIETEFSGSLATTTDAQFLDRLTKKNTELDLAYYYCYNRQSQFNG